MYIDFDKIFEKLENEALENIQEEKNSEKSVDKAKLPEIIAKECMKITEDIHGGKEEAKEAEKGSGDKERKKKEEQELKAQDVINNLAKKKAESIKRERENTNELTEYIVYEVIEIAKFEKGLDKKTGYEKYDTRAIAKHLLTGEDYKILSDKYDKKDAKTVQFFLDSSGSNEEAFEGIQVAIEKLSKMGYTCYIADCGNGFIDAEREGYDGYNTEEKLRQFKGAKLSKVFIPCVETAKKMCEQVDFSIILGDFDGLSSFSKLSKICDEEKIPYFFNTETRYTWDCATYHDWVDEEYSTYPLEKEIYLGDFLMQDEYHDYDDYDYYDERSEEEIWSL